MSDRVATWGECKSPKPLPLPDSPQPEFGVKKHRNQAIINEPIASDVEVSCLDMTLNSYNIASHCVSPYLSHEASSNPSPIGQRFVRVKFWLLVNRLAYKNPRSTKNQCLSAYSARTPQKLE